MKSIVCFFLLFSLAHNTCAQNFTNNDLNGIISGFTSLPTDWQAVPFTDINCQAMHWSTATPDLTDLSGPAPSTGIVGNPYSGITFLSGLHAASGSGATIYHEGIMQTVSGFNIGCYYSINFFQAVVKQYSATWDATDSTGSWAVYVDDNLIGLTAISLSSAPYASTSFNWDFRNLIFKALDSTHTIKFLPFDDDSPIANVPFGGLRMGIDSIYIIPASIPNLDIGNDTNLCLGVVLTLDATITGTSYLWQDNSTNPTLSVSQTGTYWVEVSYGCSVISDTIIVTYSFLINDLGNDTTLCSGKSLTLDATASNATYLWQDGSIDPTFNVSQAGTYWVEVSDTCSVSDTIVISDIQIPSIELGHDTILCTGVMLTLDATTTDVTYLWQDNSTNSTFSVTQSGTYLAQLTSICGTIADSIIVEVIECECSLCVPDAFTPNGIGINVNDRLYIFDKLGYSLDAIQDINFKVFNRWGELVFEAKKSSEIIYPEGGWNGLHIKSGKKMEVGVYVWLLRAQTVNGVRIGPVSGNVSLIR